LPGIEAGEQRLGDVALIDGAVVEKSSFVAHLLDDVVGPSYQPQIG
jgi:hypothetical protein